MQQSETIGKLAEALAAAQGEMQPIPRTKENPYFKSKYADLAAVVQATTPILAKHGLAVAQFPGYKANAVDGATEVLTTIVMHSSGEWVSDQMPLLMSKRDAQGLGSAVTYARRYAYGAAVGIVTDDDDDGQQASQPPRRQAERPAAAAREATKPAPQAPVDDPRAQASGLTVVQGEAEPTTNDERRKALARVQLQQAVGEGLPEGLAEALWKAYKPSDHEAWVEGLKARMAQRTGPAEPNGPLVERAGEVAQAQRRTRQSPMRPMP
jgi:hypothetical protein